MGTQNKGVKYQSISFDKQFISEIKKHIENKKGSYRSIADFARAAIRDKIFDEREREKTKKPYPWTMEGKMEEARGQMLLNRPGELENRLKTIENTIKELKEEKKRK